jgi:ParB-like nuclease domain
MPNKHTADPAADQPADGPADSGEERRPPRRLLELGNGLELWVAHVDDLHEQELNAQAMAAGQFERLTATIERDARLESLPFCALTDPADGPDDPGWPGRIEIVSGHHRTRAARAAGVDYIHFLLDVTGLSRDQIRAKQLAHNALHGESEAQLVRRIYEQIADVDARLEAYVAPEEVEVAPERVPLPDLDLDLAYRAVLITFLPTQFARLERAIGQILAQVDLKRDAVYLVDEQLLDGWRAITSRLRKEYDARALSVVVSKLIDAAAETLGIDGRDPADIDPAAYVPLAEVLGTAVVPPDVARRLAAVVAHAVDAGTVTKRTRWQVLEEMVAAYADAEDIPLPAGGRAGEETPV